MFLQMEDFSFDKIKDLYHYIITQNEPIPQLPVYINDVFKKEKLMKPLSEKNERYLGYFKIYVS